MRTKILKNRARVRSSRPSPKSGNFPLTSCLSVAASRITKNHQTGAGSVASPNPPAGKFAIHEEARATIFKVLRKGGIASGVVSDAEYIQYWAFCLLREREKGHKSEGRPLPRTPTPQLKLYLHRHAQVVLFRRCPLRRLRARRCYRSVIPSSVIPRHPRLTQSVGKRDPRDFDLILARQASAPEGGPSTKD